MAVRSGQRLGAVIRVAFAAGVACVLTATLPTWAEEAGEPSAAELMDDLMWGRAPIGGPFDLVDHNGMARTDTDFRGKLLLVYFGYTYCPDICPTDLTAIGLTLDKLGSAGDAVQPLFITIDPERDTVDRLANYVPFFHPRLIGLTGEEAAIRRVAHAYKVYYKKVGTSGSEDYVVDHTGFIYLVDPKGQYLGFFPAGTSADRMAEFVGRRVAGPLAR